MSALYKDFVKKGIQRYGLQFELRYHFFCHRLFGSILFKNLGEKKEICYPPN